MLEHETPISIIGYLDLRYALTVYEHRPQDQVTGEMLPELLQTHGEMHKKAMLSTVSYHSTHAREYHFSYEHLV